MRHHLCGRSCLHGYQICLLQTTQALTCLISSGSKCFSHVNTLPLSIWFWKSLSMTHLRQLIWPLFLPLLVFCISWWVQFKDTNPFNSTACTATKHRTVVTRHSIFNTTNSEMSRQDIYTHTHTHIYIYVQYIVCKDFLLSFEEELA